MEFIAPHPRAFSGGVLILIAGVFLTGFVMLLCSHFFKAGTRRRTVAMFGLGLLPMVMSGMGLTVLAVLQIGAATEHNRAIITAAEERYGVTLTPAELTALAYPLEEPDSIPRTYGSISYPGPAGAGTVVLVGRGGKLYLYETLLADETLRELPRIDD
jgi:hypothetical protein